VTFLQVSDLRRFSTKLFVNFHLGLCAD